MTGPETQRAIVDVYDKRREMQIRLMHDYDETVFGPALKALEEQCPHEDNQEWDSNGVGWVWTSCRWCGKRMRERSLYSDDSDES